MDKTYHIGQCVYTINVPFMPKLNGKFDCAHSFDYVPEMQNFLQHYSMDVNSATSYKNIEYVKNELIKLAEQLVPLNMAIKKLKGDE